MATTPERRSRWAVLAAAIAALALSAVLLYVVTDRTGERVASFDDCVAAGFPVMESHPRQCSDGSETFVEDVAVPVATSTVSASGNVRVTSPLPGEEVASPLSIRGEARAFENTVNWRVLGEDGSVLGEGFATADAPDVGAFGAFRIEAQYLFHPGDTGATGRTGTVEVFTYSAKDGSVQDLARVPVAFLGGRSDTTAVRAYFSSVARDPQSLDCALVEPVMRAVPRTGAPARAALEELLKGPTEAEVAAGARTSIPAGVRLTALSIVSGVAHADFSSELLAAAGGSCRVAAVRAQIESTLRQFSTVRDVRVTVAGRVDALEP